MGKTKVDENMVADWARRRQKGQSFRSIASEYQVDARTVQGWVQKLMKEKDKEHWEAVSRQVDAKYLDEHHRLLLRAALALLGTVHTDPIMTHELDGERLIDDGIGSVSRAAIEILKDRGINLDPQSGNVLKSPRFRDEAVTRLSRKLVESLIDHEPEMQQALNQWQGCWSRFQQAQQDLTGVAKNLFKQRKLTEGTAEELKWVVVKEALEAELRGKKAWESRIKEHDGKEVDLVRFCPENELHLCKGSKEDMNAALESYDKVLLQVSHIERITPLVNAYHDLQGTVQTVADLVDRMILMGKPQGRCTLCPSYSPVQSARPRTRNISR